MPDRVLGKIGQNMDWPGEAYGPVIRGSNPYHQMQLANYADNSLKKIFKK